MAKRVAPVNKNDMVELKIDAYTSEGYGIGRIDGFAVFVPYALKDETVRAHIIKVAKGFAIGKLTEIISPNNTIRVESCCSEYLKCGGCDLQHMSYAQQLSFKRDRVLGALKHLSGLDVSEDNVYPTLSSPNILHYRNKASFPFSGIDGKVRIGFFAPRSHRLVPISDCPIQTESIVQVLRTAEIWANKYELSAYDDVTHDGILRHLVIRTAGGQVLVTVVTSGTALPFADKLYEMLCSRLPNITGLVQNINSTSTNVILGDKYKLIYGNDTLCEEILGLKFNVRIPSFLQVNHEQTERLYSTVLDFLQLEGNETVVDVYCGIGTISLLLAQHTNHVIGIESVPEAIEDARINAAQNGIANVEFIAKNAEAALPLLIADGKHIDAIVIDPPRKGCEPEVLNAIIQSTADKLVYVSCNPETLARDIKMLSNTGFDFVCAQPVDMFPQTEHVETVVLMSRA